jgi:hypothetical protein
MSPRQAAAVATLLAALASGCAARRAGLVRQDVRPKVHRGALAEFTPDQFRDVFTRSLEIVRTRGDEVVTCEARVGALTTGPVEFDARCGETTCLSRETTRVKLGYRRARVTVVREIWNPTVRAWTVLEDDATLRAVAREEREVADQIVGRGAPSEGPRAGSSAVAEIAMATLDGEDWEPPQNPCGPQLCRPGQCVAVNTLTVP